MKLIIKTEGFYGVTLIHNRTGHDPIVYVDYDFDYDCYSFYTSNDWKHKQKGEEDLSYWIGNDELKQDLPAVLESFTYKHLLEKNWFNTVVQESFLKLLEVVNKKIK